MITKTKLKTMFSGMGSEPVVKELLEGAVKLNKKKVRDYITKEVAKLCTLEEKSKPEFYGVSMVREGTARHREIELRQQQEMEHVNQRRWGRDGSVICAVCRRPVEQYEFEYRQSSRTKTISAQCHGRREYLDIHADMEHFHVRNHEPYIMFRQDAQRLSEGEHEREIEMREDSFAYAMRRGRIPRTRADAERMMREEIESRRVEFYNAETKRIEYREL